MSSPSGQQQRQSSKEREANESRISQETSTSTLPPYERHDPNQQQIQMQSHARQSSSSASGPRSPLSAAFDKVRAKVYHKSKGTEQLAGSEAEYQKQREREEKEARRRAEYERLGLGDRTKFGMGGNGMNMKD